jgi:hypothetical protein
MTSARGRLELRLAPRFERKELNRLGDLGALRVNTPEELRKAGLACVREADGDDELEMFLEQLGIKEYDTPKRRVSR